MTILVSQPGVRGSWNQPFDSQISLLKSGDGQGTEEEVWGEKGEASLLNGE